MTRVDAVLNRGVGAYRRGAETVERLDRDIRDLFEEAGQQGLTELPHVGRGRAGAIREILTRGRWSLLERLRGDLDPERLFQTIPGIGPALARRILDELGVDTLEALEVAAHDGRLEGVEGIGEERAAMVRAALGRMLRRDRSRRSPREEPEVELLLDVDREYREEAEAGALPTIAPRRFNPEGERVVRGRERECRDHYRDTHGESTRPASDGQCARPGRGQPAGGRRRWPGSGSRPGETDAYSSSGPPSVDRAYSMWITTSPLSPIPRSQTSIS